MYVKLLLSSSTLSLLFSYEHLVAASFTEDITNIRRRLLCFLISMIDKCTLIYLPNTYYSILTKRADNVVFRFCGDVIEYRIVVTYVQLVQLTTAVYSATLCVCIVFSFLVT